MEQEDIDGIFNAVDILNKHGRPAYSCLLGFLQNSDNEEACEWIIQAGKELIESGAD